MGTTENTSALPLIKGRVYEAKRPLNVGGYVSDREIVWISADEVQYDSPSVPNGRRLPRVSHAEFRNWAARDITDEMPEGGDWRRSAVLRRDRSAA